MKSGSSGKASAGKEMRHRWHRGVKFLYMGQSIQEWSKWKI